MFSSDYILRTEWTVRLAVTKCRSWTQPTRNACSGNSQFAANFTNVYRTLPLLIIIIAPLTIVSEDQWGDLECLYKDCQAARTDGRLFTDTGVDGRGDNERQSENDYMR